MEIRHLAGTIHISIYVPEKLITIIARASWLSMTTAGGQLTSRSRLERLHIVSQGRVPTPSGHISSSPSPLVLDICMVG